MPGLTLIAAVVVVSSAVLIAAAVPHTDPAAVALALEANGAAPRLGAVSLLQLFATQHSAPRGARPWPPPALEAAAERALFARGPGEPGPMAVLGTAGAGGGQSSPSDGVVCPSFLHPDIQRDQLRVFLSNAGVPADAFIAETLRLCGGPAGPMAMTYSGSWADHEPSQNDVRILQGLTQWVKEQKEAGTAEDMTWQRFSKPDNGASTGRLLQHIATHPNSITATGRVRLLDFGCGSGQDIVAAKQLYQAQTQDTLCLDIFKVTRSDVTPILLDASSDDAYRSSLQAALVGNAGTVHIAISMVTFHHIRRTQRPDAFSFLSQVLAPGGIFIMAEWDNSLTPNRWIYYDLVHVLPSVLFYGTAPTSPTQLQIGTEYLSVDGWIAEAQAAGLSYDEPRSTLSGTPQQQADRSSVPNRDFIAVWGKR